MTEIYVLAAAWTFASFGIGVLAGAILFGGQSAPSPISERNRRQLDALMARTAR